jgi:hypothetical protein
MIIQTDAHDASRLGSTGWIIMHKRPGRAHAHEVAEVMRKPGETYTLTPVDFYKIELPAGVNAAARFRVDYTGEALSLVPTRLLTRAAKLLNKPGNTHGDIHNVLREIVGAADTTTKGN